MNISEKFYNTFWVQERIKHVDVFLKKLKENEPVRLEIILDGTSLVDLRLYKAKVISLLLDIRHGHLDELRLAESKLERIEKILDEKL